AGGPSLGAAELACAGVRIAPGASPGDARPPDRIINRSPQRAPGVRRTEQARALDIFDPNWEPQRRLVVSVAIATALSALVGAERELADRPAGLRTHAILGAAACLLVSLGDILVTHFVTDSMPGVLRADPIRIVEAVVTGTAFLGAGTIFRQ